ncbi:MAG TPA: HAD-IIA family hydrolase [Solirubrobacteraceae bacterium]|nr:HAD-IIA family hydrolase [Solirubrobacteraceae bacterium]
MPLSTFIRAYEHVLLDLDGCVWVSDELTPGAGEALAELRAAGMTVSFITNDSALAPEEYVRKLWSLGLRASLEEVVTVGASIQFMLATANADGDGGTDGGRRRTAFVIGSPAIHRHVADAGVRVMNGSVRAECADLVVVAAHERLSYAELRVATRALLSGAELVAAGRDATFPTAEGASPGTGMLVAGFELASGCAVRNAGKPDPAIFRTALDRVGPGRAVMIGDRLDSDLAGAAAAGLDGAIVLTGLTTRAQAEAARDPAPVRIADTLHDLVLGAA